MPIVDTGASENGGGHGHLHVRGPLMAGRDGARDAVQEEAAAVQDETVTEVADLLDRAADDLEHTGRRGVARSHRSRARDLRDGRS